MSLPPPGSATTVLVTGAASGIGAELARGLAQRSYNVTLVDRQAGALEAVAAAIRSDHRVVVDVHVCDLTVDRQRQALVRAVRGGQRTVVGLCNNAGIASVGRFHELPFDREQEIVRVNAVAVHHLTAAFLSGMVERGEGAVLNTASLAANQPLPNLATYAATKAFVHAFSEAIHAELAGTGVSCTSLCPGATATDLRQTPGGERAAQLLPAIWADPGPVARAGIDGMLKGRRTVVPGIANRALLAPIGRHAPRSLGLPLVRMVVGAALARGRS